MLVARRKFPLGDRALEPGDEITLEEQRALPPRRIEQLKHLRLVEEETDEGAMDRRLDALTKRVEKLEGNTKPKRKVA